LGPAVASSPGCNERVADVPPDPPPRRVTLVLCTGDGAVLGSLPPFDVTLPWWQEVSDVVAAARAVHGLDVVLLRLLATSRPTPHGGDVTYLAEVTTPPSTPLRPWLDPTTELDHPLRQTWARPGGPAADLAWADDVLARRGTPRTGAGQQMRSWNLSSLWRLPTTTGLTWLKVVPPFFAHEGRMLATLDPAVLPPLIAHDGPRVLLAAVPGEDRYDAAVPELVRMVDLLVGLQVEWTGRTDELRALGAADWRSPALGALVTGVVERAAGSLDMAVSRRLESLVGSLPQRFADIAACGVPETLVHGDFHPGNVIGDGGRLVLIDWGDSGVGHPLLDHAAFVEPLDPDARTTVIEHWSAKWRALVPGCDPDRARELLAPLGALQRAAMYQMFLDNIEPSERVFHAADPAEWLLRATAAC
jgi:Phosphotransferase enzyme family